MLPPSGAAPRVPDHLRSWSVPWPGYHPVDVTPAELRTDGTLAASVADGWAEPATDPTVINYTARQATALVPFDVVAGRPRNPAGRTGRRGRRLAGGARTPPPTRSWSPRPPTVAGRCC